MTSPDTGSLSNYAGDFRRENVDVSPARTEKQVGEGEREQETLLELNVDSRFVIDGARS